MLPRILALALLVFSCISYAEAPLTRANLSQYFEALAGLNTDMAAHSKELDLLEEAHSDIDITDGKAWAALIRKQPYAGKISASLKRHGFDSIESFAAYGARLFTAMMAVSYEQAPAEMASAMGMGDEQIAQMRAQGVDEVTLSQMEAAMAESRKMMQTMQSAAGRASEADKRVVKQNFEWLQQQFELFDGAQSSDDDDFMDN